MAQQRRLATLLLLAVLGVVVLAAMLNFSLSASAPSVLLLS